MKTFSPEAHEWLRNYHGSIDSTALLLAFEAGRRTAGAYTVKEDPTFVLPWNEHLGDWVPIA